ncbi:hypothetical protein BES34_008420 [Leptospira inadai serovar Lyme]|uniref:Uncharacterized protein n=1 Tax=Leptospira inadai serovar Lyme TaxID=293084 RepID=A0ABX4YJ21_9LEPT|nr:hypothetical protein BES34_008420 [Leptospira inadai serovar Lyme]
MKFLFYLYNPETPTYISRALLTIRKLGGKKESYSEGLSNIVSICSMQIGHNFTNRLGTREEVKYPV